MAEDKSEEAKGQTPEEEKPPGYYSSWDENARPGIDVCEKCAAERNPHQRQAPLYLKAVGWEHLPEDQRDGYGKLIEQHKYDLEGKNLRCAVLKGIILGGANLKGAQLRGAHFEGAYLVDSHLEAAHLKGAHLEDADLRDAHLEVADLEYANLRRTDLRNANITGANLYGAEQELYSFFWTPFKDARLWWTKTVKDRLVDIFLLREEFKSRRLKKYVEEGLNTLKRIELLCKRQHVPAIVGWCARRLRIGFAWLIATSDRVPITRWDSVSGIDTARTDSVRRRYIRDIAYIEDFRKQYPGWAFLWRWTCFYGQSFGLWAFWCLAFAAAFALLYWWKGYLFTGCVDPKEVKEFLKCFYFSIVAFTTLGFGDIYPKPGWGQFWAAFEVILGYIGLGGLISILANKVARRA